jgi:Tol biopolymer transport system component
LEEWSRWCCASRWWAFWRYLLYDGKHVVFSTRRDGNYYEVYEMKADVTKPTNLTNNPASDYEPAWRPRQ